MYAEKYAVDQEAFFKDYAEAHAKLSNLGAKFDPPEVTYEFKSLIYCHIWFFCVKVFFVAVSDEL